MVLTSFNSEVIAVIKFNKVDELTSKLTQALKEYLSDTVNSLEISLNEDLSIGEVQAIFGSGCYDSSDFWLVKSKIY